MQVVTQVVRVVTQVVQENIQIQRKGCANLLNLLNPLTLVGSTTPKFYKLYY